METISIAKMESVKPVDLTANRNSDLMSYFVNSWEIYEMLFDSIGSSESYYLSPDPLRNPLIFYWGHTAAFYINKFVVAGLLDEGVNPHYEKIFARGVDPDDKRNLDVLDLWPRVDEVNEYRATVFDIVVQMIESIPSNTKINRDNKWWSLMMGIEHDRIHFETSSVLIRQLSIDLVCKPDGWGYAPSFGMPEPNSMINVIDGSSDVGKPKNDKLFGWDNEYGELKIKVKAFSASKNLISNSEFLKFVEVDGYRLKDYWTEEGWEWNTKVGTGQPKFWINNIEGYSYRAMFDEMSLPLDWPAEVNAHEAQAYCNWIGNNSRLLTEGEFQLIASKDLGKSEEPLFNKTTNLNLAFGSPTPVGHMENGKTISGFNDIYGNVWDLLQDDFYPLPGFEAHPYYTDFSEPYFDNLHGMLLGGS
ncbi:MAG: 5-histidylcysteine sulfoxide synthase, partial [Bacteroidetes bacterium]|nr:5-histidylcysteine sulfoxide synthase [Bacteroidota bacterium]